MGNFGSKTEGSPLLKQVPHSYATLKMGPKEKPQLHPPLQKKAETNP